MLVLSRADVEACLPMRECVDVVREAFAALSTGHAQVPLRTVLHLPEHETTAFFMPAHVQTPASLAVKAVNVALKNAERGLPLIHGLVLYFDPDTGEPRAVMEGGSLTALCTGAASGVATDLLAKRGAGELALFGAGVQARTQLGAVCAVRPIRRVWVAARSSESAQRFAQEMAGRNGLPRAIRAAASPEAAVQSADVVCTATRSSTPVYPGLALAPGVHVNGVGSFTPQMQENDLDVIRRASKIVVDQRAAAWHEAGDLIVALNRGVLKESDVYAELGEIAAGLKPGRERDDEITFFKSVGNAVQDAAVARRVFENAKRLKRGVDVAMT